MSAPRSLRARITLAALLALTVGGVVAGALLLAAVQRDGRAAVDHQLARRADRVVLGPGPVGRRFLPAPGGAPPPAGPPPGEALLAGSETFTQAAIGDRLVVRRGDVPAGAPGVPERTGLATLEISNRPWRSLTVAGPTGLRVQFLSSLAPVQARVAAVRRLVILLGLLALALTGLAAWFFTGLAVRPLARLRAGAARVSGAQDLATSLPDDEGPEEVRTLARALNDMLARLRASSEAMERALEATRRFAADAGHELRTPLTGLRANLDALERNPGLPLGERAALVAATVAEQERMTHLLEGLQALARGEAAESLPREEVELGDLVDAAVHSARSRHLGVGFELEDRMGEGSVHGWPSGLRVLVDNLLDNAARHGGALVRVTLDRIGGALVVRVEDDGPGVPAHERERVLEPFTRGAGATAEGSGLGLAIVAQQAALHGGGVSLGESPLGGLSAEVRMAPAAGLATAPAPGDRVGAG